MIGWGVLRESSQPRLDYVLDAHGYQPLLNLNVMPYLNVAGSLNSYFAERSPAPLERECWHPRADVYKTP